MLSLESQQIMFLLKRLPNSRRTTTFMPAIICEMQQKQTTIACWCLQVYGRQQQTKWVLGDIRAYGGEVATASGLARPKDSETPRKDERMPWPLKAGSLDGRHRTTRYHAANSDCIRAGGGGVVAPCNLQSRPTDGDGPGRSGNRTRRGSRLVVSCRVESSRSLLASRAGLTIRESHTNGPFLPPKSWRPVFSRRYVSYVTYVQTSKQRGEHLAVVRGPTDGGGSCHGTTGTMANPTLLARILHCELTDAVDVHHSCCTQS